MYETCLTLTKKALERRQQRRSGVMLIFSGVSCVDFDQVNASCEERKR